MEELAFKEIYSQYKPRISCFGNLKPWMTVGAIYNIKMNRLVLAPAGMARFVSFDATEAETVCLKAI